MEWDDYGTSPLGDCYEQGGQDEVPGKDEYVTIFSLLHSVDSSIIGFRIVAIDEDTQEWECVVFYPNDEEGIIRGKGALITSMAGGSKYDISDRKEDIRKLVMDPEYPLNSFLEPRET